jgi:adenylate cyclase
MATSFGRDLVRARREVDIALELCPSYAMAFNSRGVIRIYDGDPEGAIPDIEQAMRLDPEFTHQYMHFLGIAHFMLEHYETAAAHFRARIVQSPQTDFSRGFLVAALGHLGQREEAAKVWSELKAINPNYSFAEHIARLPFRRQADIDRAHQGYAKSGINE